MYHFFRSRIGNSIVGDGGAINLISNNGLRVHATNEVLRFGYHTGLVGVCEQADPYIWMSKMVLSGLSRRARDGCSIGGHEAGMLVHRCQLHLWQAVQESAAMWEFCGGNTPVSYGCLRNHGWWCVRTSLDELLIHEHAGFSAFSVLGHLNPNLYVVRGLARITWLGQSFSMGPACFSTLVPHLRRYFTLTLHAGLWCSFI